MAYNITGSSLSRAIYNWYYVLSIYVLFVYIHISIQLENTTVVYLLRLIMGNIIIALS